MRRERAYFAAGFLGVSAAGFLAGATALALASGPPNAALAPAAGICSLAFFAPGLAFLSMWRRARIRELGLEQIGALLQSYQVIRVGEMAEKLRKSEEDAEQLMALAIAGGYARGRLDAKTGWFVAEGTPADLVRERTGEA